MIEQAEIQVNLEQEFIEEISKSNISYIDAIIHFCDKRNLEVEYFAQVINKNLAIKDKILMEAETLNLVKKTKRLPI